MAFALDLHVHTRRYSPCAETLDPALLGDVARSRGLGGILLAEHDVMWSLDEARALERRLDGVTIYRGAEISAAQGHFLVTGIHDLHGIEPGIDAHQLVERVSGRGGVVVVAHPFRPDRGTYERLDAASLPDGLHAAEVVSTVTFGEQERAARALAQERGWIGVGGSDAHFLQAVGRCYTVFEQAPQDERALAAAIRAGQVRAVRRERPTTRSGREHVSGCTL